ncbi:hypothetical protein [Runella limosa]|uniref:hypothetical protein n=1 Tax=Runella limosa TaxID=370978 RepID=UPI0004007EEF|nr:hypothetical protein [Runella limosa]
MNTQKEEIQDFWAVISLFGHSKIAGRVSSYSLGGASFVLVSVPETEVRQAYTKMYNPSAIYDITPTDEQTCKIVMDQLEGRPLKIYGLREEIDKAIAESGKALPEGNKEHHKDNNEEQDECWW